MRHQVRRNLKEICLIRANVTYPDLRARPTFASALLSTRIRVCCNRWPRDTAQYYNRYKFITSGSWFKKRGMRKQHHLKMFFRQDAEILHCFLQSSAARSSLPPFSQFRFELIILTTFVSLNLTERNVHCAIENFHMVLLLNYQCIAVAYNLFSGENAATLIAIVPIFVRATHWKYQSRNSQALAFGCSVPSKKILHWSKRLFHWVWIF